MPESNVVVDLPFGDRELHQTVPRKNLLAVLSPAEVAPAADPAAEVLRALRDPIGARPLSTMVHPGQRIVVLIDDKTRPTPQRSVLPTLLYEIEVAARDTQITLLIATGTHVPLTQPEITQRVGPDIAARYRVVNHDWRDVANLIDLGVTQNGTPIRVNRLVVEADLVVAVGGVVPHPLAGWGGGAKIIQPGVCGRETTNATHDLETFSPVPHLGRLDNPMRLEIEAIVRRVPLHFMVNVVYERRGRLVNVTAGDPIVSHHAAVELARRVWEVPTPALADIVVASSHPADSDYWQAAKALSSASLAVKRGGDIVLAAPCPEGFCGVVEHVDTQVALAGVPSREILHAAKRLGITDGGGVNVASILARTNELAWVQVFSPGMSDAEIAMCGHERAPDVQGGLQKALERQGPDARVVVMTHGGDILPVLRP